jgi:hypothetical protein
MVLEHDVYGANISLACAITWKLYSSREESSQRMETKGVVATQPKLTPFYKVCVTCNTCYKRMMLKYYIYRPNISLVPPLHKQLYSSRGI